MTNPSDASVAGGRRFAGWRALVTGASAGIGQEMARVLADWKVDLVLTARRKEKLDALAEELRAKGVDVVVIAGDLGQRGGPAELVEAIATQGLEIDLLVNNAGVGVADFFSEAGWAPHGLMLQVNVVALTELTSRLLDGMLERKRGHIVNVGSVSAFAPMPRMAAYGGTKAYVKALSEGLSHELRHTPVGVTAVHPGGTRSEFSESAGMDVPAKLDKTMMTSREVALIGLKAAAAGKTSVVTGFMNKLTVWAFALAPTRLVMMIVDGLYRQLTGGPKQLPSR